MIETVMTVTGVVVWSVIAGLFGMWLLVEAWLSWQQWRNGG